MWTSPFTLGGSYSPIHTGTPSGDGSTCSIVYSHVTGKFFRLLFHGVVDGI